MSKCSEAPTFLKFGEILPHQRMQLACGSKTTAGYVHEHQLLWRVWVPSCANMFEEYKWADLVKFERTTRIVISDPCRREVQRLIEREHLSTPARLVKCNS